MKSYHKHSFYLLIFALVIFGSKVFSNSHHSNTSGSHTGFLSIGNRTIFSTYPAIYFNNETEVFHPSLSIIQELGMNFSYNNNFSVLEGKRTSMYTSLALEPRWYYKNGGNNDENQKTNLFNPFLSLKIHSYIQLGFAYYSYPDKNDFHTLTNFTPFDITFIIPRWGFRGIINDIFYYELGLGLAYYYNFSVEEEYRQDLTTNRFSPDINAKVGIRLYQIK